MTGRRPKVRDRRAGTFHCDNLEGSQADGATTYQPAQFESADGAFEATIVL